MLFGEEQMASIAFTGGFDPQTVIAPAPAASSPRVGERVEAYSEDDWYKGYIADVKANKFKIHYYGFEQSDDEWVTSKMIRVSKNAPAYKIGEKVEIEWKKQWYPATIVNVNGGSHLVTYNGYGHDWDEWVTYKRIRRKA